jgi:serine/arginine repetitive matrix protein 2
MYNGIGLQTARGSGTNGYVQRNLSAIVSKKRKIEYQDEKDRQLSKPFINKPINDDIAEHQRKRQIENKCLEYEERLKEQGLKSDEIEKRLKSYRERIQEESKVKRSKKEEKFFEFFKELDLQKEKEKIREELRKKEEERKIREEMDRQEKEKKEKSRVNELMEKINQNQMILENKQKKNDSR